LNKKKAEQQKQQNTEETIRRTKLPRGELEMFGVVTQLHGAGQIKVLSTDGKERNCRIPGKMKKRVWIRDADIVIIKLWDFQPSKADIIWRYTGVQAEHLRKKGYLDKLPV
jgi:translation initiation factor 1A